MDTATTASDPRPPPPREPGIDGAAAAYLDALRAGAANWVVVAHLLALYRVSWWPYQGGGVAVVVFFLLSGFLISQSMMKRRSQGGPKLPGFLADRVARILTPYVPALLLVAVVEGLFIDARLGGSGLVRGPIAFVGNLLMLQDHPLFQALAVAGAGVDWRVRPYNSAEPFWTVAIEMWLYVAVGALFFVGLGGDRARRRWLWPLLLASVPVLVWNAAAGGGKSLSLIWLLGALAGLVLPRLAALPCVATRRRVSACVFAGAAVALAGHVGKFGFDPYELQTACLLAMLVFAPCAWLQTTTQVPRTLATTCGALAAYSYSLYLIHNTAIALVWTLAGGTPTPLALTMSVVVAHVAGLALYAGFERHHRRVGAWLRPRFEATMSGDGPMPSHVALSGLHDRLPETRRT